MHHVMTVKRWTEDTLDVATRAAERVGGAILAVLVLTILCYVTVQVGAVVLVAIWPAALLMCGLLLLGLYIALSSRRFTFCRDSQVCVAHIRHFGIWGRRQGFHFTAVRVRRYLYLGNARFSLWLYEFVLVGEGQSQPHLLRLGYARHGFHAETLATSIAEFTGAQLEMPWMA